MNPLTICFSQRQQTKSPPPPPVIITKAQKVVAAPRALAPVNNVRNLRTMMNDATPTSPMLSPRPLAPTPTSIAPGPSKPKPSSSAPPPRLAPSAKRWSAPTPAPTFVNTTMGRPPVLSKPPGPVPTTPSTPGEVKPVVKVAGGIANLIARYQQEVARP